MFNNTNALSDGGMERDVLNAVVVNPTTNLNNSQSPLNNKTRTELIDYRRQDIKTAQILPLHGKTTLQRTSRTSGPPRAAAPTPLSQVFPSFDGASFDNRSIIVDRSRSVKNLAV